MQHVTSFTNMHCGLSENSVCICRINIQYSKYSINRIVCIFVLIIRSMFYLSNMLTYSISVERFSCSWTALLTWGCLHCKWQCLLLLYNFIWMSYFRMAKSFQTMLQCIQMIWNTDLYVKVRDQRHQKLVFRGYLNFTN